MRSITIVPTDPEISEENRMSASSPGFCRDSLMHSPGWVVRIKGKLYEDIDDKCNHPCNSQHIFVLGLQVKVLPSGI